jgi:hypothetical protein
MFEIPHRPHGKIAYVLAPTHACTTANALVNSVGGCHTETLKSSHRPHGKIAECRWDFLLTCPNRLSSFNWDRSLVLPGTRTCQSRLQNPIAPMGDSRLFCLLFAGRRCLCLGRHSDHLIVHHQWERSYQCKCSCSKVPIAPMGKCLVDMSISILIFYDGCCLELPAWSTCYLCLILQKFPSLLWGTC